MTFSSLWRIAPAALICFVTAATVPALAQSKASKDEIFAFVKETIVAVDPDVRLDQITSDLHLIDLGLDELDRWDVYVDVFNRFGVKRRLIDLYGIRNLGGLVDFIYTHQTTSEEE